MSNSSTLLTAFVPHVFPSICSLRVCVRFFWRNLPRHFVLFLRPAVRCCLLPLCHPPINPHRMWPSFHSGISGGENGRTPLGVRHSLRPARLPGDAIQGGKLTAAVHAILFHRKTKSITPPPPYPSPLSCPHLRFGPAIATKCSSERVQHHATGQGSYYSFYPCRTSRTVFLPRECSTLQ